MAERYSVKDLWLATFALYKGLTPIELHRESGDPYVFEFELQPFQRVFAEWRSEETTVNLLQFHRCFRELKAKVR